MAITLADHLREMRERAGHVPLSPNYWRPDKDRVRTLVACGYTAGEADSVERLEALIRTLEETEAEPALLLLVRQLLTSAGAIVGARVQAELAQEDTLARDAEQRRGRRHSLSPARS